jgi:ribonuclease J
MGLPCAQPGRGADHAVCINVTESIEHSLTTQGKNIKNMANYPLRLIPLGGLGEIGKNMMVFEYGRNIMIVDSGVKFPENDLLGIDLVIPDFTYIRENADRVRGIVITHGHEDHIGSLPYLLREINAPIYTSRLSKALIEHKLREHKLLDQTTINLVEPGQHITIGPFTVELLATSHSIPDGYALAIETPIGLIVHSSDFKFDFAPVHGQGADFGRLAQLGAEGVLALLSDSTGAERPGFTPSETIIDEAFDRIFSQAKGRIIVTTFASLLSRVQQVVNAAARHGRKVAFTGYSMRNNTEIARELGYLDIPNNMVFDLKRKSRLKDHQQVILTTGSQGQPEAALARMAEGRHRDIDIKPGDTVIVSSHPIPGNEEEVGRVINNLILRGAEVIYPPMEQVHVSGHASQGEQRLLLSLVKPKYFIPVHGEPRMLYSHKKTAMSMGLPEDKIFIMENGDAVEFTSDESAKLVTDFAQAGPVFVDGTGVGDIGPAVLKEREILSDHGFVVVLVPWDKTKGKPRGPVKLISKGFVYLRESSELMAAAVSSLEKELGKPKRLSKKDAEERIKSSLGRHLYEKTKRRPMIVPILAD